MPPGCRPPPGGFGVGTGGLCARWLWEGRERLDPSLEPGTKTAPGPRDLRDGSSSFGTEQCVRPEEKVNVEGSWSLKELTAFLCTKARTGTLERERQVVEVVVEVTITQYMQLGSPKSQNLLIKRLGVKIAEVFFLLKATDVHEG